MKLSVCFLLLCANVYLKTGSGSREHVNAALETPSTDASFEHLLENLLKKLEFVDDALLELRGELHLLQNQTLTIQTSHEKTFSEFMQGLQRLEERMEKDVGRNMSALREQSSLIVQRQTACANCEMFCEKLFNFTSRPPMQAYVTSPRTSRNPKLRSYLSCKTVPSKVSGVYIIRISNATSPFKAFCEQEKFNGGWLVVQHRFDGSVDFYRNWTQYREGFGNVDKEFWFGLKKIHQITTARPHKIIIEVKDFHGVYKYARYDAFKLSGEKDQYRLTLGKYNGTAGNSMKMSNGMKFSTMDRDNDVNSDSACARQREGAWWFKNCTNANLNGRYQSNIHWKSMYWFHFQNDFRGISYSRIMIREL